MPYPLREEVVRLRALQGAPDPQAVAALENKRRAARAWMEERGTLDLNKPLEVTPLRVYSGAVNSTMEGV